MISQELANELLADIYFRSLLPWYDFAISQLLSWLAVISMTAHEFLSSLHIAAVNLVDQAILASMILYYIMSDRFIIYLSVSLIMSVGFTVLVSTRQIVRFAGPSDEPSEVQVRSYHQNTNISSHIDC